MHNLIYTYESMRKQAHSSEHLDDSFICHANFVSAYF